MTARHKQCLEALDKLGEATAREVSEYMVEKDYSDVNERNIAHPRLNELKKDGKVEVIGKKIDSLTGKKVSIYRKC
ncbi:MAG: hypothetical protein KH020_10895 [Clostridiales bacterium]|nr:hypothetical protein [Clostridiales bacterium]